MKDELLKEFKHIYSEETIRNYFYKDSEQEIIIECESGYVYKVSYNDGYIETECIGG